MASSQAGDPLAATVSSDCSPVPDHVNPDPRRHVLTDIMRSGGTRMLALPVSAILGIVCTRLIIDHFGQQAYAQYGLLVNIATLLPFADLGMSAAIMNAVSVAHEPREDKHFAAVLLTSLRVLFGSAAVIIVVAALLQVTGSWNRLLGAALQPGTGSLAATLCLAIVGVTLGAGFGQRILTGIGRNHVTIALMALQTPVVLIVLVLLVRLRLPGGSYLAVIPYLVTFVLSLMTCLLAARDVAPAVGRALRDVPRIRSVHGESVFMTAWPMLIQMIALPIAMQTDRIVLSHVSTVAAVAKYNLASQMFSPIWTVVSAAGVTLWPVFARARAKDQMRESPIRMGLGFGAAACLMSAAIAAAAPWLAARASGGSIQLDPLLIVSFGLLMVLQAVKYPLGMYMTDPKGLRFQAAAIVALLPVNLGLSIVLAKSLGAAGPVIGSAVGVFICQVVANWYYVRRDQRRNQPGPRHSLV